MMASEDVIELGSSDDEAQPPPTKKIKPQQNAMVHIPGKTFQGLSIRKFTRKPPAPVIRKATMINKNVTFTNVSNGSKSGKPPFHVQVSPNTQNRNVKRYKPMSNIINPFSSVEENTTVFVTKNVKQYKTNLPITSRVKKSSTAPRGNLPITGVNIGSKAPSLNLPISKVNNCSITSKLPPSITVTRTFTRIKPNEIKNANIKKLQKANLKPVSKEVLTVELDDDEGPETPKASSTSAPWYLPPENQSKEYENENKMEVKNNQEPESRKFIEITIEDSPIKPPLNKRTCEVGAELAITIDDSPVKIVTQEAEEGSDGEAINAPPKTPNSKKKLLYPRETSTSIEIEIEPMEVKDPLEVMTNDDKKLQKPYTIPIEIHDSPVKKVKSSPKKGESSEKGVQSSEFHPIFQSFIDLCFKLEDSEDMRKIVDKKIKGYYKQVPKEYTESEEFIDMVSSKIISMKAGPEKMYLYIKDIVDELNLQRKVAKAQVAQKQVISVLEPFIYGEDSEFDNKRQRQIRKLEKTLKKLHRAIQKLEEQEVDFDDEEDSVYLLTERYKERMVRVHAKLCQLTNTKMPSEPRVHIDGRPGKPSGPAKRLEKWINKKVPIGTPLPFPDFHDVLRCVREANEEDKLGWNEVDVMEEARDLFVRCGKKLQRRRQENEWRLAASRLPVDVDPAEDSELLKKKLDENRLVASKKETEVFNKFADRQSQLKLEAVEIGDKEAEESPVESDDDEVHEGEATLENKEKRKERLKRLIQEKTKKVDEQTESKENNDSQNTESVVEDKQQEAITEPFHKIESKENNNKKEHNTDDSKEVQNERKDQCTLEEVHSINSDKDDRVDSDIDELHLLQKLHSENEVNSSTIESSDTDTPIDISDTLQSSSDNKGKPCSDVISIENSSYSESEANEGDGSKESVETADKMVDATENIELTCTPPEKKTYQDNNDEYAESVENILLASSDDENENNDDDNMANNDICVKFRGDANSIGDIEVGKSNENNKSVVRNDRNLPDSESIIMVEHAEVQIQKNDNMEVDETEGANPIITSKNEEVLDKSDPVYKTFNDVTATEENFNEINENNENVTNPDKEAADISEIDDNLNKSSKADSECGLIHQDKVKPICCMPVCDMLLDNVEITPNEIPTTTLDSAA